MVNILYVCSRPVLEKDGQLYRHLIGILTQKADKEYTFEYKLNDKTETNQFMLPFFSDKNKIYTTNDVRQMLDDFLPSENDTAFIMSILKKENLTEYDEWTWLKLFEPADDETDIRLYETLPDDIVRHDINIVKPADDDNAETSYDNEEETEIEENTDTFDIFGADNIIIIDDEKAPISNDIDFFPDLFDESEQETDVNGFSDDNEIVITDEDIKVLKNDKSPAAMRQHVVTKKVIKHKLQKNTSNDFIHSPPEDPFDLISKRLEDNIKQRQKALDEKINNT